LTLEPEDELVFVAPADRRTELYLYLSEGPKQPVTFPSGVEVTSQRRAQVHQFLSSGGMQIGVQGTGLLDLSAHTQANYGRGSVARVSWMGVGLNRQSTSWAVYMSAHPFPTGEENRWRMVKLLVDGPVRKVLAVSCLDSMAKAADGSVVFQANVTRYFSMFADVPLYDVEDVVHCSAVPENWTGGYGDRCHAGRDRDENDVLWEGSSGSVRTFPLADRNIAQNVRGDLVSTEEAVDRWYAWFDEKDRMGLAVFYGAARAAGETPMPVRFGFGAGWEMWSTANGMSFAYEDLKAPTTLKHRFRVMGLGDVSAEQVAEEYRLWEDREAGSVTIGHIERR